MDQSVVGGGMVGGGFGKGVGMGGGSGGHREVVDGGVELLKRAGNAAERGPPMAIEQNWGRWRRPFRAREQEECLSVQMEHKKASNLDGPCDRAGGLACIILVVRCRC